MKLRSNEICKYIFWVIKATVIYEIVSFFNCQIQIVNKEENFKNKKKLIRNEKKERDELTKVKEFRFRRKSKHLIICYVHFSS